MPTPSTRTPVRIARGSYSNLNSSLSDLQDGEIIYAEDVNKLYIKEGSALVVLTQPAANAIFTGNATFDTNTLYVDGTNNRVGIGTTSPTQALDVVGSLQLGNGNGIGFGNQTARIIGESGGSGLLKFEVNSAERARIDSTGRLLVGHTASEAMFYTGSVQVQGTNSSTSAITIKTNQNDSGGPALVLGKSRGALGSATAVNDGDELGTIYFTGADGTDTNSRAAAIRCHVDGAPGSNDLPGRLVFLTTADGAATATERMRIDSAGRVLIGTTTEGAMNANHLTIAHTSSVGMTLRSGTSNSGNIFFSDGTSGADEYRGAIQYHHSSNSIVLSTATLTALTLDSSQNATFAGSVTTAGFSVDGKSTQVAETLSAASTITIDCSTGNYFTLTAGQNTTFAFSNVPSSGNVYVLMLQVAVATYSLTWPAAVKWSSTTGGAAPTLTANKVTNFVLVTSDGGTTWRASANTDYAS